MLLCLTRLNVLPRSAQLFPRRNASSDHRNPGSQYDVVIIGGGHNGLTSAGYMAKCGMKVCVLERRHVLGGAAVTEEIVPGFRFSRCSYVLSLLRPVIVNQLNLKNHGLQYMIKDPTSFTPLLKSKKSLLLGSDRNSNLCSIAQFSQRDAEQYYQYEDWLGKIAKTVGRLIDYEPLSLSTEAYSNRKLDSVKKFSFLAKEAASLGMRGCGDLYELLTAPAEKVLRKWFESEPLLATLAADGVIGAMVGPGTPGSAYVLLHHVMGELGEVSGAWGFVIGGMGAVSQSLANAARSHGAEIFTDKTVKEIRVERGRATSVVLDNGAEITARHCVMSNATPKVTFLDLLPSNALPSRFLDAVRLIDYTSPVTKINIAVNKLPNFSSCPNSSDTPMPHHKTTIHLNCETMDHITDGFADAQHENWSRKPFIEMTIPSSVDNTISPKGCHVVNLFTQYTRYTLKDGRQWDESMKKAYAEHVFDQIEVYCPGFRKSIIGYEALPPPELERIFGLTGGNIFHGSMSLDQLYWARPVLGWSDYRTPIQNLYLCGSGAHPGGGVMGAPGRLAALAAMKDARIAKSNLTKFNGHY